MIKSDVSWKSESGWVTFCFLPSSRSLTAVSGNVASKSPQSTHQIFLHKSQIACDNRTFPHSINRNEAKLNLCNLDELGNDLLNEFKGTTQLTDLNKFVEMCTLM